jgi:glutamyl-Q tRNA(Asp) synthetase
MFRTRFAPSPTGPLHLGHAYSAILAHDMAQAQGGEFLLRIEDIDQTRSRDHWEARIYDDLSWLGLHWPAPVMRQSERQEAYRDTLQDLWQRGLLYPCTCTRRDIAESASAPQEGAPALGPDGLIYPGTCRNKPRPGTMPADCALRLDMAAATAGNSFYFMETGTGSGGETDDMTFTAQELIDTVGDVVLSRREMGTSYHLSVVLDDAEQEITHVVRGSDLFEATKIHVVIQDLLGLPSPVYHHHHLIRDENGKRLAKRDDARAIALYRSEGATPDDLRKRVGL